MPDQQEWQPVRIAISAPHVDQPEWDSDHFREIGGLIVRVRQEKAHPFARLIMQQNGCDSQFIYVVHPEDIEKLGKTKWDTRLNILCAHEILAD